MKRKKHICVIGLGEFGRELARQLAKDCAVLALDRDERAVEAIVDEVQRALILDVQDFHRLSSIITSDYDEAIVSMGEHLESSVLATLHLKKIGAGYLYAREVQDGFQETGGRARATSRAAPCTSGSSSPERMRRTASPAASRRTRRRTTATTARATTGAPAAACRPR